MGGEQGEEVSVRVLLKSNYGAMNCSTRQLVSHSSIWLPAFIVYIATCKR
jgi:hypothetical protein